ncbi:3-oxoacyl-(acyl-carrier-protein) reductase [Candidatus Protofrankia californiensis]|uniref:3-oxoacyl-(Acyl-carrier-protein) reductase n=1 Tax=Candidatus Protofrankia californiensis TaxID=1839754 RepID=A0A1C3PAA6_9ACTN|nr:3-oxoacyl-(acyl-carrier-protein) reductase [Candidatus Protofrankia californiensis]
MRFFDALPLRKRVDAVTLSIQTVAPACGPQAAAINLARSATIDYGYQNIRINAIAPGITDTPRTAPVRQDPRPDANIRRRIPLGRWGDSHEQAKVIWFLATPESSYITGAVIPNDGGLSASNGFLLAPTYDGEPMRTHSPRASPEGCETPGAPTWMQQRQNMSSTERPPVTSTTDIDVHPAGRRGEQDRCPPPPTRRSSTPAGSTCCD